MERGPDLFPISMGTWIALCVAAVWLFHDDREPAFKRRWFPPFVVGSGVVFVLSMLGLGFPVHALVLFAPAVALILGLQLWQTVFCPACGALLSRYTAWLAPARYCPRCGAELEPGSGDPAGELLPPEQAAAVRTRVAAASAAKSAPADPPAGAAPRRPD